MTHQSSHGDGIDAPYRPAGVVGVESLLEDFVVVHPPLLDFMAVFVERE